MLDTRELRERIKTQYKVPLLAIAPASALENEPEGKRPSDLLPGAKSIIVFGRKMIYGSMLTEKLKFEEGRSAGAASYLAYGADQAPDLLMLYASYEISKFIERELGEAAMPLPFGTLGIQNCQPEDPTLPRTAGGFKQNLPFNIAKAAQAAGMGQIGWNGFFVTKEYGPRAVLGAIITTAELDCDAPLTEALCDPATCGVCIAKCPVHAIPEAGSGEGINANRCTAAACGLLKGFGRRSVLASADPTDEELRAVMSKMSGDFPDHIRKSYCDLCALYCPVGQDRSRTKE